MSGPHGGASTTRDPALAPRERRSSIPGSAQQASTDVEASTWVRDGIVTGVIGASVIAVFFLIVDILQGRPLWTPTALGSAVFLGEAVSPSAAWRPPLIAAYTALHGGVFVAAGLAASFAWLGHRRRARTGGEAAWPGAIGWLVTAGMLFGAFEAFFLTFFVVFEESMAGGLLMEELGGGRIALANLLAACAMAASSLWPPFGRG